MAVQEAPRWHGRRAFFSALVAGGPPSINRTTILSSSRLSFPFFRATLLRGELCAILPPISFYCALPRSVLTEAAQNGVVLCSVFFFLLHRHK